MYLHQYTELVVSGEDGDILKSLAGLFSIYLGFSATFLFLSDFGVIEPDIV